MRGRDERGKAPINLPSAEEESEDLGGGGKRVSEATKVMEEGQGGREGGARTGVRPLPDPYLRDPLLIDGGLGGVQGLGERVEE